MILTLKCLTKILKLSQYQNYDKATLIIYADFECLIEKTDGCKNNPENSPTSKVGKHILSSFSMPTPFNTVFQFQYQRK